MQILYLGPPDTLEQVRSGFPEQVDVQLALDERTADSFLPASEVILDAFMGVPFPADRLARAESLKLVVTVSTGADHIDAAALKGRGIPLLTLGDQREVMRNITPAAEHSWLLLMACARQLRAAIGGVLAGEWNRNKYPGIMLQGKTLGVIGCGRIGEWMSRYAAGFRMKCIGFDPQIRDWPATIERVELATLLRDSDFISVHVPLTDATRRLLGPEEFMQMRRGVVVINTSRGEVLDESALESALRDGTVGAAGVDVLAGEPDVGGHPLLRYARERENLIITPHIGGFSPDALRFLLAFSCERVIEHLGLGS
jgi:phosphoglycerate dehydrogenase-like enzyme